jgi:hypothetical protein
MGDIAIDRRTAQVRAGELIVAFEKPVSAPQRKRRDRRRHR